MTEVIVNTPGPWSYGNGQGPALPMPQAVSYEAYENPPPPMPAPVEPGQYEPTQYEPAQAEPTSVVSVPPMPVEPPVETPAAPVEAPTATDEAPAEVAAGPLTSSGRVAVQVVDRMRTNAERGTTTVPTMVIEKIVTMNARGVPGVHAFGATGEAAERPVVITLDGRTATVHISLVIEYGFAVHTVTEKVRTKVISALENLFGLDVTSVDLVVEDIHVPESEDDQ